MECFFCEIELPKDYDKDVREDCIKDGISIELLDAINNAVQEKKCPKCNSYMKWWVTGWQCRNLNCRHKHKHV